MSLSHPIKGGETLDSVPIDIAFEALKPKPGKRHRDRVQRLLEQEKSLIRAKAVYKSAVVTTRKDGLIGVDGVLLKSRVLAYHLEKGVRVFPFVVSIGNESQRRAGASKDLLQRFYLDAVLNLALNNTRRYLKEYLAGRFGVACLSHLSPGSIDDWPIEAQSTLFSLLNGAEHAIGVKLTENLLMVPTKSVSGIFFPTQTPFQSCQLCPRDACPGRRAQYSRKLFRKYGLGQGPL